MAVLFAHEFKFHISNKKMGGKNIILKKTL